MREPLNPDAYGFIVLQRRYRDLMDCHASLRERARDVRAELDRINADADTAAARATSVMETLLKLQQPRDAASVEFVSASGMEAQRGETENTGSTAEGGDSLTAESGDAQTPIPSSRERK